MWTSLRVRNSWSLPSFLGSYLQEPHQGFHDEEPRVIPMWLWHRKGNIYIKKYAWSILVTKAYLLRERTVLPGEGHFPASSPLQPSCLT